MEEVPYFSLNPNTKIYIEEFLKNRRRTIFLWFCLAILLSCAFLVFITQKEKDHRDYTHHVQHTQYIFIK